MAIAEQLWKNIPITVKNLILYHPRLWLAVLVGLASYFLLPAAWNVLSRVLAAWNVGVLLFLVLVVVWMARLSAAQICKKYIEEDESAPFILLAVIIAALLSVIAIIEPLATMRQVSGGQRIAQFALAAATLVNSWLLVPTMFATHYADMFYSVKANARPLRFPDTPEPVFWDFAYFSFTISAACQTADVSTTGPGIRRVVLLHTLLAFLFNASILGFAINVTAGLLGGN